MPNGYRRGGSYTRNGRQHYRHGTRIASPGLLGVAGGVVAITALTGGSLVGSPVLIALTGTALLGLVAWRYRRQLAPVGRRMLRWADTRAAGHGRKAALVARVPR